MALSPEQSSHFNIWTVNRNSSVVPQSWGPWRELNETLLLTLKMISHCVAEATFKLMIFPLFPEYWKACTLCPESITLTESLTEAGLW